MMHESLPISRTRSHRYYLPAFLLGGVARSRSLTLISRELIASRRKIPDLSISSARRASKQAVLQLGLIACLTALAFAGTELLAYASLSRLLSEGITPSVPLFIIVSASSVFVSHYGLLHVDAMAAILYGSLSSLAVVDLRSGYVPNAALAPLSVLAVAHGFLSSQLFAGMFGLLLVGGVALFLHVAGRGTSFGLGDVKLLAVLGGILGAERSLTMLSAAFIIGAVIAVVLFAIGRASRKDAIPFVPLLALAYLVEGGLHAG